MTRYPVTGIILGLISTMTFTEISCVPIFSFPDFSNFHSFFPDLQPESQQDVNFSDMERIVIQESANGDISRGNLNALKGTSKDKIAVSVTLQYYIKIIFICK